MVVGKIHTQTHMLSGKVVSLHGACSTLQERSDRLQKCKDDALVATVDDRRYPSQPDGRVIPPGTMTSQWALCDRCNKTDPRIQSGKFSAATCAQLKVNSYSFWGYSAYDIRCVPCNHLFHFDPEKGVNSVAVTRDYLASIHCL